MWNHEGGRALVGPECEWIPNPGQVGQSCLQKTRLRQGKMSRVEQRPGWGQQTGQVPGVHSGCGVPYTTCRATVGLGVCPQRHIEFSFHQQATDIEVSFLGYFCVSCWETQGFVVATERRPQSEGPEWRPQSGGHRVRVQSEGPEWSPQSESQSERLEWRPQSKQPEWSPQSEGLKWKFWVRVQSEGHRVKV